jgi:hypothetical protein
MNGEPLSALGLRAGDEGVVIISRTPSDHQKTKLLT